MQATTCGETVNSGFCFKTSELLFVLSCVFICLGHKFYGIFFLVMAIVGVTVRFGISQQTRKEEEDNRRKTINALSQVENAVNIANFHKDSVH